MLLTTSGCNGIDSSPVISERRGPERDIIQSQCSARSIASQKKPSRRTDPKIQRRKKISFAGIASGDADRISGTQPACDCTHLPSSRRKCQPTHAIQQNQQHGTPNHPQQPQLTQTLTSCEWHCW